jgi:hypothetical protein
MAQLKDDNTQLKSTVTRLLTDLSEVHDDLRILHPLPYARLHFQKCINRQIACNDAVNAFIDRHTLKVINVDTSLTHQLQELKKELKKAWDARFAASHLCDPPPTLANVLHIIAERGFTKEVKWCMNLNKATRSCKMIQKVMREVKGKYEWTQMHYFAAHGMKSSVNRMLSMKGIDVESRDKNQNTPLTNASAFGHIEIVESLLNHGARIDAKRNDGCTPLYFACRNGHFPVVNLLINRGANVEASSINGWRPLHSAAWNGHLEIVKALIAKGVDMNARTNAGESALGWARRNNQSEVFALLRSLGAVDDGI